MGGISGHSMLMSHKPELKDMSVHHAKVELPHDKIELFVDGLPADEFDLVDKWEGVTSVDSPGQVMTYSSADLNV